MKLIREIKNRKGDIHFQRYAIFESKYFNIYKHIIRIEDKQEHLHNHPWNYFGIITYGGYVEQQIGPWFEIKHPWTLFWGSRKKFHKVARLLKDRNETLFFTFGKREEWGYDTEHGYVESSQYKKYLER